MKNRKSLRLDGAWTLFNKDKSIVIEATVPDCHGLDTIATIFVNGQKAANTNNQFRRYIIDITRLVGPGENKIAISFEDATRYAQEAAEAYPYYVPDMFNMSGAQHGFPCRNFIRKEQCSFSWDWGPAFAPCGHGTLSLSLLVHESKVSLWWPRGMGDLTGQTLYPVTVQVSEVAGDIAGASALFHETFQCGFRTCRLVQDAVDGNLAKGTGFWFEVNGVSFFAKGTNWIPTHAFDKLGTWEKKKFLLESCIEASMNMIRIWGGGIYEEDAFYDFCDRHGILIWQEFMFACALCPSDTEFLDNVRHEVEHQVKRLKGHPSLVLWSGNNENQEFMVKGWDEATVENPYIFAIDYNKLYIETIRDVVLKLDPTRSFISSSPSAGVISETPYTERYVLKDCEKGLYGDVHFYDYKHNGRHVEHYPNTRFASEYGAQSMPSFSLWKTVSTLKDWHPLSRLSIHRNHHANGQQEILQQIEMQFKLPRVLSKYYNTDPKGSSHQVSGDTREVLMDVFCFLSQVVQARSIGSQTEHYRRGQGSPYKTMGALYWQWKWKMLHYYIKRAFQDVLISTVELPDNRGLEIHVSNTKQIEAQGTLSIRSYGIDGIELNLPLTHEEVPFFVQPQSSQCVLTLSDHVLKKAVGHSKGDQQWQLLSIDANVASDDKDSKLLKGSHTTTTPKSNQALRTFHLYPSREPFPVEELSSETSIIIEDMRFQPSESRSNSRCTKNIIMPRDGGDGDSEEEEFSVEFTIQSTAIAGYVWLEWIRPLNEESKVVDGENDASYGYFDDNGFWLLPLDKKVVRYYGRGRCDPPPNASDISIKSLFDALQSFDFK
ncbi:hypothetical protein BGW42_000497 [Actinomortierella wolfii]|nr:hypothetical protein BGW42_000497 [Actinomortierella wolfii]